MRRSFPRVAAWASALLCAIALLFPAPEPAAAQTGRVVDAKKLDSIRERMEKGQALFVAGDYTGAAKVFEAGYAELPYAAFLFNAGVAYQKVGDVDHALERFRGYLTADPNAPDAAKVQARIAALLAAKGAPAAPPPDAGAPPSDAGEDGAADAGAPTPPTVVPSLATDESMKSLALIETDPAGAPVKLYARTQPGAAPFKLGAANPGWTEVVNTRSPANLTLEVGSYHVVVEPYLDYRACEAEVEVRRAKVFHFRANLSQGEFMSFLRVAGNVQGAYVFLDDDKRQKPPWGTTPHGELVSSGSHTLLVEAPGFEPFYKKLELAHGDQTELEVKLVRVGYGFLRVDGNTQELKVQVDEKAAGVWRGGEAPLDVKLDAGPHKLTIASSGYKTYEAMVSVPHGQVQPVHAELIPKYPRGAAWTQAVIGAVFLGAGAYLGVQSNKLHDELVSDRQHGVLEEGDSRIKKGRLFAIGADAGFAVGGVLAIFATYNFIKDPLPPSGAKLGKPIEFDDPRKARPTARSYNRRRVALPHARPRSVTPSIGFAPTFGGFAFGGSF